MTTYIALLRAVNVGGTGKLPMSELQALCGKAGFAGARTYIASGNVVFSSKAGPATVKAELQKRLLAYAGKPIDVLLRTGPELQAVLEVNPFSRTPPNRTYVFFLDEAPPKDALDKATGVTSEKMRSGKREIYVQYPEGMGLSKLKIPAVKSGTARNMNTVAALVRMASELDAS